MGLAYHRLLTQESLQVLSLTWAGRVWRWANRPVAIPTEDGADLGVEGGLPLITIPQGWELFSTSPSPRSIPLEVNFPEDVAALVARGHDLATATGELALWFEGQTWEERVVLLKGHVVDPAYGSADETVTLNLETAPWDDRALIPTRHARVTTATWPDHESSFAGRYYPIPVGKPGLYQDADGGNAVTPGTPALVVEWSGSAVDKLLIAGEGVEATTVLLQDGAGDQEVRSVTYEEDGLGRRCAVINMSGSALDLTQTVFWVIWAYGYGILFRQEPIRTAGQLLAWLLTQTSMQVDVGRTLVAARRLPWEIAGYIDDAKSPHSIIQDELGPFPFTIVAGPLGLYPVVYDPDVGEGGAVDHIEAGPGVVRTSRMRSLGNPADTINEIRIEYAYDAAENVPRRTLSVGADRDTSEPDSFASLYAWISRQRAQGEERHADPIESRWIYSRRTALKLAMLQLRLQGFLARAVAYEVGIERAAVWAPGDVVTLTDAELHLSRQVCMVDDLQLLQETRTVAVELRLIGDPIRDNPPAT